MRNLSNHVYLRAATEMPMVAIGAGLVILASVALGARAGAQAGLLAWVNFISPEGCACCDDALWDEDDTEDDDESEEDAA